MNKLPLPDQRHLDAAEGWLGLRYRTKLIRQFGQAKLVRLAALRTAAQAELKKATASAFDF